MQTNPNHEPNVPASKAEKMSVLSSLLGPEGMKKLRADNPDLTTAGLEVDASRVAWHRNRLLERLRSNAEPGRSAKKAAPPEPENTVNDAAAPHRDRQQDDRPGVEARLASNLDRATLGSEHPAVIAKLLSKLDRGARIETLKSLPGPVARTVVRRLRQI